MVFRPNDEKRLRIAGPEASRRVSDMYCDREEGRGRRSKKKKETEKKKVVGRRW